MSTLPCWGSKSRRNSWLEVGRSQRGCHYLPLGRRFLPLLLIVLLSQLLPLQFCLHQSFLTSATIPVSTAAPLPLANLQFNQTSSASPAAALYQTLNPGFSSLESQTSTNSRPSRRSALKATPSLTSETKCRKKMKKSCQHQHPLTPQMRKLPTSAKRCKKALWACLTLF